MNKEIEYLKNRIKSGRKIKLKCPIYHLNYNGESKS